MLNKLDKMRNAFDIDEWKMKIKSFPGSEGQGIQVVLRTAKDRHELLANSSDKEVNR